MAQTIKLRRSSTAGSVPTTSQLALGEVAINTADGKLFIKKDDGTQSIVEIGAGAAVASSPVKFDDISGSFNGSDTTFNITVSSSAYTPGDVLTTIVSLNGVTQEPNTAYTISGSQITFTDPPASNDEFYGIDLSTIISQAFGAGTEASPGITFTGDTDTGIYKPAANTLGFCTSGDEKLRIDSSGKLLVGGTTNVTHFIPPFSTLSPRVQVSGTTHSGSSFSITNYNSGGHPGHLLLGSSKGGTVGTQGIVANDGDLGRISFTGSDGTNLLSAASILAEVDGTPGTNDMPGRLVFQTTSDGSTTLTERMRIDSGGFVGIKNSSPSTFSQVNARNLVIGNGSGDAGMTLYTGTTGVGRIAFADGTAASNVQHRGLFGYDHTNDRLFFGTAGTNNKMVINSSGRLGVGTSSPEALAHLRNDNTTTYDATDDAGQRSNTATILVSNDNGTTNTFSQLVLDTSGTNQSIARIAAVRTGTSTNDLAFVVEGSNTKREALRITGAGNVGIGTTSPSHKLMIKGNNDGIRIEDGSGTDGYNIFRNDTTGFLEFVGDQTTFSGYRFYVDDTSEKFAILNNGNVGIGTSSPSGMVHALSQANTATFIADGEVDNPGYPAYGFAGQNLDNGTRGAGMYLPNDGQLAFSTVATERMRIDSSGRLLVGTSSSYNAPSTIGTQYDSFNQTHSAAAGRGSQLIAEWSTSTANGGASLKLAKSNSGTVGTHTALTVNQDIGSVIFAASDGTNFINAAHILAEVDGTSGTNDMPSRLVFSTTADGASTPTERMRIGSAGQIGIGGANYGTSGQVLTSNGSSSAPSWQDAGGGSGFDSGTAMLFQQTAAPTGWTKSTTHNNKALRVVSGTAGSGGSSNFDSVFGSSISTNAHTLTISQIPAHTHGTPRGTQNGTSNMASPGKFLNTNIPSTSAGSGGSHSHTMSMDVAYVDTIIATKDP